MLCGISVGLDSSCRMVARAVMLVLILGAGVDMAVDDIENRDLVIVTVATNRTDGYRRFERTCKLFNFEVRTLGMGQGWKGGNMAYAGGGWKVNLLTVPPSLLRVLLMSVLDLSISLSLFFSLVFCFVSMVRLVSVLDL